MTSYLSPSFFPLCSRNIISSHKSLQKCHSHNKGFLMHRYPFIPARDFSFILCKYLHFICLVENLRTPLRKINGHGVSIENLCKIFEQINEKFRAGINGYFCINLHFNGNGNLCLTTYVFLQTLESKLDNTQDILNYI